MNKPLLISAFFLLFITSCLLIYKHNQKEHSLLIGAFIADSPTKQEIEKFGKDFGKIPYFILVFVDWNNFVPEKVLNNICSSGCTPVITWEPWYAENKQGVAPEEITSGKFDEYIDTFARKVEAVQKPVYLRFAHEMNGNWYPWATVFIDPSAYKDMYRYVKNRFDALNIRNVKWIFSVNWENVPRGNDFSASYPGDAYVDSIGIDGYNWGHNQWMSFHEIFFPSYKAISFQYNKEIIITEFGSTSMGGDKARWLSNAFSDLKKMEKIRGFILFNVNKETDWNIPPQSAGGRILKEALQEPSFIGATSTGEHR